jgi:hypothetical protein
MKRLRFYLLAGLVYFLLWQSIYLIIGLMEPESSRAYGAVEGWRIIYLTFANYFIFEYAFRIASKKINRALRIILGIVITFLLITLLQYGWMRLGELFIPYPYPIAASLLRGMFSMFFSGQLALIYFGAVKFYFNNLRLRRHNELLQSEKQQSELNYLKSQTNPHFLFNTLNNIYSLARDKSDLAAESILRLSKMLRYMLYETGRAQVTLQQELKVIHDYLALEKLRYDAALQVIFEEDADDPNCLLPPLLLIPLVENAFKHGVSELRNGQYIHIRLSLRDGMLLFEVKNPHDTTDSNDTVKENIGLGNIRRQLALQFANYELHTGSRDGVFTARLRINLKSYEENKMPHR